MRRALAWTARILAVIAAFGLFAALWKREQLTRLMAVNSLFSEEKIVSNFSNMKSAFLFSDIAVSSAPSILPIGTPAQLHPETDAWIKDRTLTSLLVLKEGEIVHETYVQGTSQDDKRISWSLAKSFLSALFGILHKEGVIDSLDDPVTKYVPVLKGSAYDTATILNVLQMSSGVTFNEDYLDRNSDINRMGRVLALGREMDDFAATLSETFAPAGQQWKYVSIDTHILGMVIRGATGRSVIDLMSEKLMTPMGMDPAPYYLTDGVGVAFVLGGLCVTTRDYARLGQMFLQNGSWNGRQIVPADWVAASTTASARTAPDAYGYGYQWWIPTGATDGEFVARGIYGQYIYINRPKGTVIVATAADRQFRDKGVDASNIGMFRKITATLD